jgi:hypothetical protein
MQNIDAETMNLIDLATRFVRSEEEMVTATVAAQEVRALLFPTYTATFGKPSAPNRRKRVGTWEEVEAFLTAELVFAAPLANEDYAQAVRMLRANRHEDLSFVYHGSPIEVKRVEVAR